MIWMQVQEKTRVVNDPYEVWLFNLMPRGRAGGSVARCDLRTLGRGGRLLSLFSALTGTSKTSEHLTGKQGEKQGRSPKKQKNKKTLMLGSTANHMQSNTA